MNTVIKCGYCMKAVGVGCKDAPWVVPPVCPECTGNFEVCTFVEMVDPTSSGEDLGISIGEVFLVPSDQLTCKK